VPNLWSEQLVVRSPDAVRGLSGRCSASDRHSSSCEHRARCAHAWASNVILDIKWRHKERLGRLSRLSHITAGGKVFSRSPGMLPLGVHPLRLRMGCDLIHSGSPK
jgi:hypothetical protein